MMLQSRNMGVFKALILFFRGTVTRRGVLAMENLALRQHLAVLERSVKRPSLHQRDRIFWVWLSKLWKDWRTCLMLVQPETVIAWHRQGFRLYWRWRSRSKAPGRPEARDVLDE